MTSLPNTPDAHAGPAGTVSRAGLGLKPHDLAVALAAVALPLLIGGSVSPSSTFFNQVAAVAGWGLWLALWAWLPASPVGAAPASALPAGPAVRFQTSSPALVLVALGVTAIAIALASIPVGLRIPPLAVVLLAALVLAVAARPAAAGRAVAAGGAGAAGTIHTLHGIGPLVLAALLAAALYNVAVSLVQVFVPDWTNGWSIANATTEGRAIGNIRQPNQISTLLVWGCAAAVWWAVAKRWPLAVLGALLAALVFAVVLTASRTGVLGVVMLALWGAADRRLPRGVRLLLLLSPVFYAVSWWLMTQWAAAVGHAFHGGDRMTATLHGYGSESRVHTWLNTWELIKAHPWTGVGFGAYNFAWTLTPFPGRATAFFDHSHNLPLQLAAEFGLPAALLVLALLLASLWAGRHGLVNEDAQVAISARTALFMLAVVGVHSLLEYPLWYAYFLLPTAALWGWYAGLARPRAGDAPAAAAADGTATATAPPPAASAASAAPSPVRHAWLRVPALRSVAGVCGVLVVAGVIYAIVDFWRVAIIFEPQLAGPNVAPLADRIERGRRGLLFGQHADYARVTMAEKPETVFESFDRPLFHLVDTRLMIAYAKALAGRGELEKARDVAARLREFGKPDAQEFFSVCQQTPRAFQCGPDPRLRYEALLPAR